MNVYSKKYFTLKYSSSSNNIFNILNITNKNNKPNNIFCPKLTHVIVWPSHLNYN